MIIKTNPETAILYILRKDLLRVRNHKKEL